MTKRLRVLLVAVFATVSTLAIAAPTFAWSGGPGHWYSAYCNDGVTDHARVTLAEHEDGGGAKLTLCANDSGWTDGTFCDDPFINGYAGDDFICGTVFDESANDQINSYKIERLVPGWNVKLCTDRNLGGSCFTKTVATFSWVNLGSTYANKLSSSRLYP